MFHILFEHSIRIYMNIMDFENRSKSHTVYAYAQRAQKTIGKLYKRCEMYYSYVNNSLFPKMNERSYYV